MSPKRLAITFTMTACMLGTGAIAAPSGGSDDASGPHAGPAQKELPRTELAQLARSYSGQGRDCDAAPLYSQLVQRGSAEPGLRAAAYAAVLSWQSCVRSDAGQQAPTSTPRSVPSSGNGSSSEWAVREISEKQRQLMASIDTYAQLAPDAAELPTFKYQRAHILYERNHFAEAIPAFTQIVDTYPKSAVAVTAAQLSLDSVNVLLNTEPERRQTNLDLMHQLVDKFLQRPELTRNAEFAETLTKLWNALARQRIEQLERAGEHQSAAEQYLLLAERSPNDARLDELLYNAAISYEQVALPEQAIAVYERLIRSLPQSPLAKRSLFRIAMVYRDLADYDRAASAYEEYVRRFPAAPDSAAAHGLGGNSDAVEGLSSAVSWRVQLGQSAPAAADVNLFIKNYGARVDGAKKAAALFFELGKLYEERKELGKLRAHLSAYLTQWASRGDLDRRMVAEVKLGTLDWQAACPVAEVAGVCLTARPARSKGATAADPINLVISRKPELVTEAMRHFQTALVLYRRAAQEGGTDRPGAARSTLMTAMAATALRTQGDAQYEALLQMKPPTDWKARALTESNWEELRQTKLHDALRTYQAVAKLGDGPGSVVAAARMGQLQLAFAHAQCAAEQTDRQPAASAPGVGKSIGCARGAEQSLLAAAEEDFVRCLQRSAEFSIVDSWSTLCAVELHRMNPKRYPVDAEFYAEPGYQVGVLDIAPPSSATARRTPEP